MILKYPENICMLCIPMVMHKNPSDKSIYHWDFYALLGFLNGGKSHENY
ncbi:tetracycline resistance determinant leader peptide [Streptococcus lutetiensis 033]|nr:tetracycline resistance determinant leader peptide [Streptococcus lutetiensis 033]